MKVIDIHGHLYWENGHDPGWEIHQAPRGEIAAPDFARAVRGSQLAEGGKMVVFAGSGMEDFKEDPGAAGRANEAVAGLTELDPALFAPPPTEDEVVSTYATGLT